MPDLKSRKMISKGKQKIYNWLCKSQRFTIFYDCWVKSKDENFRRILSEEYSDSKWLHVYSNGDEYYGQIIYYIKEYASDVGFFCELIFMVLRLVFSDERGLTPYVYWGKEHLYYEPEGIDNEYNVFLYYFEAVSNIQSIENAAFILNATDEHTWELQKRFEHHGYNYTDEYMNTLSDMFRKYIRYNEKTKAFLENEYEKLIGEKKVLGVHFRGTDYRRQYNNHPVFVTIEQEIEKVKELMEKGKYELVFLATDEQQAVEIFEQEFKDRLRFYGDTWRASVNDNESVAYSKSERKNHRYLLGLEALRDQYTLTRCSGLVCGLSNLSLTARMMKKAYFNETYENLIIIDNGTCVNGNAFCDATHV